MARRRLEAALEVGKVIETVSATPLEMLKNKIRQEKAQDTTKFFSKVQTWHAQELSDLNDGVFSLQYSPDAESLVVGCGDGSIHVLSTGALKQEVRGHDYHGLPVTSIRFHPEVANVCLAASAEGKVLACDTVKGDYETIVSEPGNEIYTMDFNLAGTNFATAGKDTDIRIYDTGTNQKIHEFEGNHVDRLNQDSQAHKQRIYALKFHPDHDYVFVSGGWDNNLKIWDLRTRRGVMRTIHGPHICGEGIDIKSPYILTASWTEKDALQIWDFANGQCIYTVELPDNGKGSYLYCAQFCEKGMALAGGSGTNSVMAVNLRTHNILGEVKMGKHPVNVLDSIRGGKKFAVASTGSVVKLASMK